MNIKTVLEQYTIREVMKNSVRIVAKAIPVAKRFKGVQVNIVDRRAIDALMETFKTLHDYKMQVKEAPDAIGVEFYLTAGKGKNRDEVNEIMGTFIETLKDTFKEEVV